MIRNEKAGFPGFFNSLTLDALGVLCQRLDALGAKSLPDERIAFFNLHNLQVRIKLPPCGPHRETAAIAKLRFLATHRTNRHRRQPVLLPKSM